MKKSLLLALGVCVLPSALFAETYIIPIATARVKDRVYSTTLAFHNDSSSPARCEAIYAVPNDPKGGTLRAMYDVAAGKTLVEEDTLREAGAVGTMRLNCSAAVMIAARLQSSTDGGATFDEGRIFRATPEDNPLADGTRSITTTTDILVMEIAGEPAPFSVVVTNAKEEIVGQRSYELPAFAQQIVNLSKILGDFREVTVEVTRSAGKGKIIFAKPTSDTTLLAMAHRMDATTRERYNAHVGAQARVASASSAPTGPSNTQFLISPFKAAPFREPATGFVYMRDRWYDPETGTFLTPDPEGYGDSANLYSFGKGDPVNHSDPTGRETLPSYERTQIQCRTGALDAKSITCQKALHPERFPELAGQGHILEAYSSEPIYISLATLATADANTRLDLYASGLPGIKQRVQELIARGVDPNVAYRWGYEMRGALMEQARNKSTPLGRYVAEMMKKEQPPADFYIQKYGSAEAAAMRLGRSNPYVTRTMVGVRVGGTAIVLVGLGLSAREVINAPPMDRWHELARQSGGLLGSTGGAWGGMKLGGLIGGDIGGPPGAATGAFIGGCIGACLGNSAGQALVGDVLYQYTVPAAYGGR